MSNNYLSSIISALESVIEAMRPYKEAVSLIQENNYYADILSLSFENRVDMIENALTKDLFNDTLAYYLGETISPYHDILEIKTAITALGNSFKSLIKPETYESLLSFENDIPNSQVQIAEFVDNVTEASKSISDITASSVDIVWMKTKNNWVVSKKILANLDIPSLSEMKGSFSTLCRLEQETSLLPGIPDHFVSAASQIASLLEAFNQSTADGDIFATTYLISDYCNLAVKQHKKLHRASTQEEKEWRLGLLDAVSRYVDRQATWEFGLAEHLSSEDVVIDRETEDIKSGKSTVSLIPTYIGYTRKENVNKTPLMGLERSPIVDITEKGKRVIDGIIRINKLQLDCGKERVFSLSEAVVSGLINIGTVICTTEDQLGKVIDGLYFVFYENIEHIKLLIGNGNKEKGDELVRQTPIYQCIFSIKTIRNDFRHDLDHGDEKERKKKLQGIGHCYKQYCGNRPLKERDFKELQERLYDELILLEEKLIEIIIAG